MNKYIARFIATLLVTAHGGADAAGFGTAAGITGPGTPDAVAASQVTKSEAEARKAVAEAERAELEASLPPSTARPLQGNVDTRQFGAAGLARAFDLAQQLAQDVCAVLPADRRTAIYEPASAQGIVAALTVNDSISRLTEDLARQNKDLQAYIEIHTPPGSKALSPVVVALTVIPATLKAAADVSGLFRSDITATGLGYGDGARSLFATALARHCPAKIGGVSAGYLGELDTAQHDALLARVRGLVSQRAQLANRIAIVQRLADGAKGDEKRDLSATASAAGAALKAVDSFVESLRAGETGDKSPLFNAARYLAYANRTKGALLLDFDLRLEGLSLVKDGLFSGQRLRLAGVAFLWYRVYEPDGTLRMADAVRRVTEPVEVDLRGKQAGPEFWAGGPPRQ